MTRSLERKLQCQLDRPRVVGGGDSAEVTRAVVGADAAIQSVTDPLRVIPNIEELRAELEVGAAILVEREVLE